ncbi:MAG TPA: hypothetical protein VME66_12130, partial [Candidatus Acidoferrales bacterium]|nr:hypothetical protein [Candidatus Acidoferrales bacterium]
MQREHASLPAFARGLVMAVAPENAGAAAVAFRNTRQSKEPIREFARWAAQFLSEPECTVFVDDLQKAQKDPETDREISKFLEYLLEATRTRVKWIIATRDPLELPLASWLASGMSDLPIDEIDLVLTEAEARAIAGSVDAQLDAPDTNAIFELVKGLPFAFSMALSVWRSGGDVLSSAHATKERINEFFNEHVFSDLEPNVSAFLLKTALFRELDVNLLVLAGVPNASANVAKVRGATFCLSEESEGVFRHHDLFQEFLEERLRAKGAAALKEAYESALTARKLSKAYDKAIDLASEFNDMPTLLRLLRAHATTLFEHGHASVLERALSRCDPALLRRSAAALSAQGFVDALHGRHAAAEDCLREALGMAQNQPKLLMQIGYRLAAELSNRRQWDEARQMIARISKIQSGDPEFDLIMYGRACVNNARSGRIEVDVVAIERLRNGLAQYPGKRVQIEVLFSLAVLMLYRGTLEQSRAYAMEGLQKALEDEQYLAADRLVKVTSLVDFELGEFAELLVWLDRRAEYSKKSGDMVSLTAALEWKCALYAQSGDSAAAADAERQLLAVGIRDPAFAMTTYVLGKLLLFAGARAFEEGLRWLEPWLTVEGWDDC